MAAAGLRVLAIARRDWPAVPEQLSPEKVEVDLAFVGFVGLIDPPRPEAAQAVAECAGGRHHAGDDHRRPSADRAGDREPPRHHRARRGSADDRPRPRAHRSPPSSRAKAETLRVYARVNPEQKIAIVQALQASRRVRRDDRRRRQRRARAQERRHRRRDGQDRHRRRARGVRHGAPRRQLREHRCRGRARAGGSTRTSASSSGSCSRGTRARSSRCSSRRCSGCRSRCCRSRSCGSTWSPTDCRGSRWRWSRRRRVR